MKASTSLARSVAVLFGALALAPVVFAQNAPIDCTATVTDLVFGTVNPQSSQTDATATLSYRCSNPHNQQAGVTVCFSLADGAQGGGQVNPRRLLSGTAPMYFDIYRDAARTLPWGAVGLPAAGAPALVNIPGLAGNGGQHSGTLTLYGRVNANQTALVPGTYQNLFSAPYATVYSNRASPNDANPPGTCGTYVSSSFSFTASAPVTAGCRIGSATELNFGTAPGSFGTNLDQTSTITMTCTSGLAWQLGLDNGQNAAGTTRRLRGGGTNYVAYELYRNAARTLRWGNLLNSDTLSGSGTGASQAVPVFGRVGPQAALPAGSYSDRITVTVTY